jgi:uncharacterized damage-inducible protein DinB
MSEPVLTAQEVLKWNEITASTWRKLLTEHPEILGLACDIASTTTVAQLLRHIVAVELRYAERISRMPETSYEQIPFDSVDALFATHDRAIDIYKKLLADNIDWEEMIDFQTRSYGTAKASLKTIYFHAMLHGIRHYAQLGTLVRKHGYKTALPGDYLFMGVKMPGM